MAEIKMKLNMDSQGLLQRIEALAEHCNSAPLGDPVAELAREIGEIDASTDVSYSAEMQDGVMCVTFSPAGNLARLLAAHEAQSGVADV
jgi:hypothetical protein